MKKEIKEERIFIGYKDYYLQDSLIKKIAIEKEQGNQKNLYEECDGWSVDKNSFSGILKKMKEADPSYAYHICQYYPCWYTGIITNGTEKYEITIYAHSSITLKNELETIFFILKEPSPLFLVPCDYQD